MALGYLFIFYMFLLAFTLILQVLLYQSNNRLTFILNIAFGIFLAILAFTSQPTNYTGQRIVSIIFALVSVLAAYVRYRDYDRIGNLLVSISIIGGLVQLFI